MTRWVPAAVLVSFAALGTLTSCSSVEEVATSQANKALCTLAGKAMDSAQAEAARAAEEIGADPQAAEQKLDAIADALKSAQDSLDGPTKQQIKKAREAVNQLGDEARSAAQGVEVDGQVVDASKARLEQAVDNIQDIC